MNLFKKSLIASAIAATMTLTACSSNYQFGDVTKRVKELSKNYCMSEDPGVRNLAKAALLGMGVKLPVDYCATRNLVRAVTVGSPE